MLLIQKLYREKKKKKKSTHLGFWHHTKTEFGVNQ